MKLFLLGGFLGSGKTTAIQQACSVLSGKVRLGVITNDQGTKLVDSAFLKGFRIPNREVVKGCFCCNYTQLEKAIRSLEVSEKPEILFAESVGSCTDITATVIKPLLKFYPDLEIVYSVFADAALLLKMAAGKPLYFDEDVQYIYEKQLEEADLLIVNKTDLLWEAERMKVSGMLKRTLPEIPILFQNSLQRVDIKKWLHALQHFNPVSKRKSLEIDYEQYGSGEAKLAWLDEEFEIDSEPDRALETATLLINRLYKKVQLKKYPIGHLKFLMKSGQWQRKISFTSLNEPALKQTQSIMNMRTIILLVNARIQTDPGALQKLFSEAVVEIEKQTACKIKSKNSAAFQPGFPNPDHRIEI